MQTHTETAQPSTPHALSPEVVQCVILHDISWQTYERLLAEHTENSGTRFTYDLGRLQIMVLSAKHEKLNRLLSLLVDVVAEEMGIDVQNFGSTTFRREDLGRGFEPDSCFYIQNADRIRGKDEIDLSVDPPPDLVIEIDITSLSLNKLPIFAAVGVPEVWRYDGARVALFTLASGAYVETSESTTLPGITGEVLSQFLATSEESQRPAWLRRVREWVRKRSEENA